MFRKPMLGMWDALLEVLEKEGVVVGTYRLLPPLTCIDVALCIRR